MKKIAVFGGGLIGRRHAALLAEMGALAAIVDPSPEVENLCDELQCAYANSVETYLQGHAPDGVIVATPNSLHVAHGLACVERHIPVLIEKPIADDPLEARELVLAAKQADVPILVGHHRRHNPIVQQAKKAIDQNQLGRIVSVHAQFWLYKPDDYFDVGWRREKGAGPLFINLIHDIDLLRYLCGEIVSVQAQDARAVRGFEVEDSAVVLLQFASGALGTVSVSDTIPAPWSWELTAKENPAYPETDQFCYLIGGTKGSLSLPDMKFWHHPGIQSWWEPIETKSLSYEERDPLVAQLQHFFDVIDGKSEPIVSGLEGLKTLKVIDAIKRAANEGSVQVLETV